MHALATTAMTAMAGAASEARSLDDLLRRADVSEQVKLCIRHHDALSRPVPRVEIAEFEARARRVIAALDRAAFNDAALQSGSDEKSLLPIPASAQTAGTRQALRHAMGEYRED